MNIRKERILVVDDEQPITSGIRRILEQTGAYQVREENFAQHAVAAAREFLPDLILLDVVMPDKPGDELASEFRQNPRLHGVPIVFLTALVTPREGARSHGHIGRDRFLAKPVNPDVLIDCIREELDNRASPPRETKIPEDPNPHMAF